MSICLGRGGGVDLQLRAREEDSRADWKSSNLEKERKKTREGRNTKFPLPVNPVSSSNDWPGRTCRWCNRDMGINGRNQPSHFLIGLKLCSTKQNSYLAPLLGQEPRARHVIDSREERYASILITEQSIRLAHNDLYSTRRSIHLSILA